MNERRYKRVDGDGGDWLLQSGCTARLVGGLPVRCSAGSERVLGCRRIANGGTQVGVVIRTKRQIPARQVTPALLTRRPEDEANVGRGRNSGFIPTPASEGTMASIYVPQCACL